MRNKACKQIIFTFFQGDFTDSYFIIQVGPCSGDRPQQIVSLQKTIIKAQEDIDALIKLYARAQVNPDEAKNAMARIFDGKLMLCIFSTE